MNFKGVVEFKIHNTGDWAYGAVIPLSSGFCITITSSFGNFGYIWTHPGESSMEFLKKINMDYAMGKMVELHNTKVFDPKGTKKLLIKRAKVAFKKLPSTLTETLKKIEQFFKDYDFNTVNEYQLAANHYLFPYIFDELTVACGADYHDNWDHLTKFNPKLENFWNKLWPEILAAIESHPNAQA